MPQKNPDAFESTDCECPTCGRDDFSSRRGVKQHHSRTHGEKLPSTKTTLVCGHCGDEYGVYPYREDNSNFCSNTCRNKGVDMPRPKAVTEPCNHCGEDITRCKSLVERRNGNIYCDKDCYAEWRSENVYGENHPQWKHGNREYGKGWNEHKRREVRKRDNHKCVACGLTQEQHKERFGARLAVHHIRKARLFDDSEKRNKMENLVTLCRPCHRRWEGIPLRPQ